MNKRIFIISDLHGQGKIYNSIINYLEKIQMSNKKNKIILYINGDLIDRGSDSIDMLLDVIDRCNYNKGNIEVRMLAGNHELMMLEAYKLRKNNEWNQLCDWFYPPNGGNITKYDFDRLEDETKEKIISFLSNLPLYVKLDGKIISKDNIIISHACITKSMFNEFLNNFHLKDLVFSNITGILWKRNNLNEIGNNVMGIVGHTPNNTFNGYKYDFLNNIINIDGGCAHISCGLFHNSPLIELDYSNNSFIIHGFNYKGINTYNYIFANNGNINNNFNKYTFNVIKNIKRRKLNSKVNVIYNNSNKVILNDYCNLVSSDAYFIKNI